MVGRWRWDVAKDRVNRRKHGLDLATGVAVLADPLALHLPDPHPDGDRWRAIGRPGAGLVLLFVIYAEAAEGRDGRIISVRRATATERRAYEQGDT
ncbi:MAG: BrnT family toxin [Paracraurococcus sp.]|jgi:hypothetical protein